MKDRIAHIMRAKNLKATDFAELLGIQPSGISHILSGRNQPSLDFVRKIKETFPEYNLDWIIFGKGPMTTSEPFKENFSPASMDIPFPSEATPLSTPQSDSPQVFPPEEEPDFVAKSTKAEVKSIIVMYDDGTFERYSPR